ncbi:MAG: response regulator [Elusimicrobia bacterium]|nr:response regulator [Elusimicrobiota bacterium]
MSEPETELDGQASVLADPKTKLVLLIEDDEGQRDLIKHLVGAEGFRVEMAANGKEGLKQAQRLNPDLLLIDLMLPGIGGYELVRELQASGLGEAPVIVLTAKSMAAKTIEMIKQEPNVKDFWEKPPSSAQVTSIHSLLKTLPPLGGSAGPESI